MKNPLMASLLIMILVYCNPLLSQQDGREENFSLRSISGPYLGQKPPGTTPELFVPGIVSSGSNDMEITFNANGDEAWLFRSGPDFRSAIIHLEMVDQFWSKPSLEVFEGIDNSRYPFHDPVHDKIFFDSGGDIFMAARNGNGWTIPVCLDSSVNLSESNEIFASVSKSGTLCFSSNRDSGLGGMDIYLSNFKAGKYQPAINPGASINSG